MYIVRAANDRTVAYYVKTDQGRRGYRWVAGDEGLLAAQRFRTQEAAGEVILGHREHYGALARIVPDPLSPPRKETRRRGRRFIIQTEGGRETFYVVLREGIYRWARGEAAEAEAFRFSTPEAAGLVVVSGYNGTGGGTARIVRVND